MDMPAARLQGARPRLGISIVNYNSVDAVRALLLSLMSSGVEASVCIVDNSDEREALELLHRDVAGSSLTLMVVAAEQNLGYGRGNNLAARCLIESGVQAIWILNPDVKLLEWDPILVHEQLAASVESIWATPTLEHGRSTQGLRALNTWTGRSRPLTRGESARGALVYPAGHSIVTSVRVWDRLGGFDNSYFLFFEESDLAVRCAEQGVIVDVLQGVAVEHEQGLTTGASPLARNKTRVAFQYATESGAIFFRKHFRRRLAVFTLARLGFAVYLGIRVNAVAMIAVLTGLRRGLTIQLPQGEMA
jgi:N-acetylglucosaminyl-diphospho-decaprenol L-rhamnosyltransferase